MISQLQCEIENKERARPVPRRKTQTKSDWKKRGREYLQLQQHRRGFWLGVAKLVGKRLNRRRSTRNGSKIVERVLCELRDWRWDFEWQSWFEMSQRLIRSGRQWGGEINTRNYNCRYPINNRKFNPPLENENNVNERVRVVDAGEGEKDRKKQGQGSTLFDERVWQGLAALRKDLSVCAMGVVLRKIQGFLLKKRGGACIGN